MRLGINISLTQQSGGFSPASLFSGGQQGAWYDPSDINTLFQDSAGTTPVTAAGQPVGLILDKSQGLASGPQLVTGDNSTFTSGVGDWVTSATFASTAVATGGELQVTVTAAFGRQVLTVPATAGRWYRVTGLARWVSGGGASTPMVGLSTANNGASANTQSIPQSTSFAVSSAMLQATGAQIYVTLGVNNVSTTGATVAFDDIQVYEVKGNHATQATAGSRPIYGVQPISGRRNLVAVSSQPSASDGTSVTANAAVGPSGQMTAARVSKTDATTPRYVLMATNMTTQASTVYTLSQYVKYDGYDTTVSLEYNGIANFNVPFIATFNVTASGVSAVTPSLCTSAVTNEGNGWYRVSATLTSAAGPFTPATNPFILSRVTGASGVTVLMTDIQVEVAAAPTAYQNVVSQYNVTEAGVQSVFYLSFDGVDDSMATSTITPGTDKAQVFAGLRKLSDASIGLVLETSADTNTNNGTLLVSAPNNNATGTDAFTPKGTGIAIASASGYAAPITSVVTGIGDIAANASTLRVNGVQAATSTGLGTGNFLAYPMYIGRRGGATLPFNGSIYGLVVRFGPNLDASTISTTESWMNTKTGAY